jgi:hypothetical protein
VKPVGERSAGNPHAAFDERGEETGPWCGLRHRYRAKAAGNSYSPRLRSPRLSSTLPKPMWPDASCPYPLTGAGGQGSLREATGGLGQTWRLSRLRLPYRSVVSLLRSQLDSGACLAPRGPFGPRPGASAPAGAPEPRLPGGRGSRHIRVTPPGADHDPRTSHARTAPMRACRHVDNLVPTGAAQACPLSAQPESESAAAVAVRGS